MESTFLDRSNEEEWYKNETKRHYPKTKNYKICVCFFFFFRTVRFGSKSNWSCLCLLFISFNIHTRARTRTHIQCPFYWLEWTNRDDYLWNLWSISVVKPLIFKYARDSRLSKYCTLFWKLLLSCLCESFAWISIFRS